MAAYVTAGQGSDDGDQSRHRGHGRLDPDDAGRAGVNGETRDCDLPHTYMFLTGIGSWFGATYATVPLTAVSEMRTEIATGL